MGKYHYSRIVFFFILFLAAWLRLYRIGELTEFLGDQGRTGIHIYEAWKNKQLPLVGPTVLSGQYLGPAFYYIMAPAFILFGFNPIAPAVFTAILGVGSVGMLYLISKYFFGWKIAAGLAAIWAVSPQIIASDRVLWEPNLIPFFIFLFLMSLAKKWNIIVGIALGILVQLHYPNLLFIGLTFLFYVAKKQYRDLFYVAVGFIFVLAPFLFYEATHGFENILGVLQIFFLPGEKLAKRQIVANAIDYGGRVIQRILDISNNWKPVALSLLFFVSFFNKNKWNLFILFWFITGVGAISVYRGVVFDHYLFFLLPAAFLLLGFSLSRMNKKLAIIFISVLICIHLFSLEIFKPGTSDIGRTRTVAQEIILRAAGEPFSFGLIASRSFSDLHYRYFFKTSEKGPVPILSNSYRNLFLVCEIDSCPPVKENVQIICYDPYCSGEYPKISLNSWKPISTTEIAGARLYQYQKQL